MGFDFPLSPYLTAAALLCASVVASTIYSQIKRKHRAPGPPRLPLLGNVGQISKELPWFKLTEWSKQYGPIFSLDLLGQHVLVLNSHKSAAGFLERCTSVSSDRPRLIMGDELMTRGMHMVMARYGEMWRKMRRTSTENLNTKATPKYKSLQAERAIRSTLNIIANPADWEFQMKRYTFSNIVGAVLGWEAFCDEEVALMDRIYWQVELIGKALMPGNHLVEFIPAMKYLPTWVAAWKSKAVGFYKSETKLLRGLTSRVENEVKAGTARHSIIAEVQDNPQKHGLSEDEVAWLTEFLLGAGAETTSTTLLNFVLAMRLHPESMRKAQAELDSVIGRENMPQFQDRDKLPYVRAIVKEMLRWRTPTPLAIPHATTEDSWYEGYFVPKGTVVLPNVWAINHDPEVYGVDSDQFRPERFLDETGQHLISLPDVPDVGHASYGYGRRICAGIHFAEQSLFISIATMLWAVNIGPAVDDKGNTITPSDIESVDTGIFMRPAPFACSFTPRFPEAPAILEHTAAAKLF
ncbi:cytochrome P450 [Trametopsis cervina]|nr:cytochrome P450 [Trametopsis cervina]